MVRRVLAERDQGPSRSTPRAMPEIRDRQGTTEALSFHTRTNAPLLQVPQTSRTTDQVILCCMNRRPGHVESYDAQKSNTPSQTFAKRFASNSEPDFKRSYA